MDLDNNIIILFITIPADGTMSIYMYLLAWFKHYLCILAINKYNNENKVLYTCNKFWWSLYLQTSWTCNVWKWMLPFDRWSFAMLFWLTAFEITGGFKMFSQH